MQPKRCIILRIDFRIKLTFIIVIFTFAISITLATTNHFRLKDQAIRYEQRLLQQDIDRLVFALENSEKANYLLAEEITEKMREGSIQLQQAYLANPNLDDWSLPEWKQLLSFDIHMIDQNNSITHSTVPTDVGLNFNLCCTKLARVLDQRRTTGEFYHDGFDVEQATGTITKYSYMATPDQRYIIQLGYSIQDSPVFQEFNFLHMVDQLRNQNHAFLDMNILNIGGLALGNPIPHKLSEEHRIAFQQTLTTGQPTEIDTVWEGMPAKARFIHYLSNYDKGTTQQKILEIIYHDDRLQAVLDNHIRIFMLQMSIIFLGAILLAYGISRWIARPMYLAFHDSLTGLKNRAAFDESIQNALLTNKGCTALFMIDLDNFKQVNDQLGHDQGDALLINFAQLLRAVTRGNNSCFRLGGDEFMIILPSTTREDIIATAELLLQSAQQYTSTAELVSPTVSLSIGIAIAPEHGSDEETLCKHADIALYQSKERGKNQYHIYEGKV